MKQIFSFSCIIFLLMINFNGIAQKTTLTVESSYFNPERQIRYTESVGFDSAKPYQLFVVLDESTLYDYTVSVINYISQWKEIPQYIVLGVPNDNRWDELHPSKDQLISDLPFFNFLNEEFDSIHCVKNASFRILVGHSLSAKFGLQYFFRNSNYYSALVAISPPLIPELRNEVKQFSKKKCANSYVYICSGDQDLRYHTSYFLKLQKELNNKNSNVHLDFFKDQPNTSHSLMPLTGIKNGLMFVLDDYLNLPAKVIKNIASKKNIKDSLLECSYKRITDIYGITPQSRPSDIQGFVEVYLENSRFAEAHRLSDMFIEFANKGEVYDLIDAYYLKGLIFEKQENYSLALAYYNKGFAIIPEEVLNKADFKEDIIRMEKLIDQ